MENLDTLLLAAFCFFMGAIITGVLMVLRSRGLKGTAAGDRASSDLVEVAHLWRSRKNNRLVVDLDGQQHASVSELSPSQRQHLSSAAAVLKAWLMEAGAADLPAAQAPAARSAPSRPLSPAGEVSPVQARPLDALSRAFTPAPAQKAPQFKSMAVQINEILQRRLTGSPFSAQGISLMETPEQGVIVRVGAEEYPGVDAIPDPAVRGFIREAVAEWEAQARGGIR